MVENSENKQFISALNEILHTLTENEEAVMRLRCGLYGGKPLTLAEVEERLGLTRERIRQIEAKAWRKLRHPSRIRLLHKAGNITSYEEYLAYVSANPEQANEIISNFLLKKQGLLY